MLSNVTFINEVYRFERRKIKKMALPDRWCTRWWFTTSQNVPSCLKSEWISVYYLSRYPVCLLELVTCHKFINPVAWIDKRSTVTAISLIIIGSWDHSLIDLTVISISLWYHPTALHWQKIIIVHDWY